MRWVALALFLAGGCDRLLPLGALPGDAAPGSEGVDAPSPRDGKTPTIDADLSSPGDGPAPSEGPPPPPPDLQPDTPTGPCLASPVYDGPFAGWTVPAGAGAPLLEASTKAVVWAPQSDLSAFYQDPKGGTVFVQTGCPVVLIQLTSICNGTAGGDKVRLRLYDASCLTDVDCDGLPPAVDVNATCNNSSTLFATKASLAPGTAVRTLRLQSPASTVERRAIKLVLTPTP